MQSTFHPNSAEAAAASELAWLLIGGAAAIFVVVMALAAAAVWWRPAWLGRHRAILIGGVAFPASVLCGLLVYSLTVARAIHGDETPSVRIEVVGHQWWWRVRYLDPAGRVEFETANEIRVPIGRRIEIALASADVLHSFWVPNLSGKLDMIPGRSHPLRFTAREPGVFRGQCAEYCGGPHAQMALYVVAERDDAFERWRERQREPAVGMNDTFLAHCAVCHTVRGTHAKGTLGPDLTHVGSRVSLGAGILPNNRGTLAAWIVSNQHVKPGNLMPAFGMFEGETLDRLAVYLHGLE
jgi:cytochrome c oxidase subunit 2